MSVVERFPQWRVAKLTAEQHRAYDRLAYGDPSLAECARLKIVLKWKRTREENLAFARELLADGAGLEAVADALRVTDRSARRIVHEARGSEASESRVTPPENRPLFPLNHAAAADTSCGGKGSHRPGRPVYGSDPFNYDFRAAIGRPV